MLRDNSVITRKLGHRYRLVDWVSRVEWSVDTGHGCSLTEHQQIAKDAGAVYRVKRVVLVNTEKVDRYMENFCDEL